MKLRTLAIAAIVAVAGITGSAAAQNDETRSTTAQPVESKQAPDAPDAPGILDERPDHERTGIGQDITIRAGETHDGDVTCVRGHVTIDGHVNGDVTVVAGSLEINGSVEGDVTGVVSGMTIDPKAKIDGDLTNVGGTLRRNGAAVRGQVVNVPFGMSFPTWGHGFRSGLGSFVGLFFWWKLFAIFLFFVCALLLSALVPDRIRLISDEAPGRIFTAFIFGLVGYVVLVFVQAFLTITLIGIPLVGLIYLIFVVLKWLAMCGIFHQIGYRVGRALGRNLSLLGAILVGVLPFALLRFIPFCVGFSIWFLVEILAFGYLILTRVGTRREAWPAVVAPAPMPPPPPADPIVGDGPLA